MSEVTNGDTAGNGPTDAGRPEHARRTYARRQREYIAQVEAAHRERIALLEEQHKIWKAAAAEELALLDLEARAAEEGERRDAQKDGEAASDAQVDLETVIARL